MPLDVSTLSLRVDSGGSITQATSDLNKFSNAAEKAETRANSLLASINKLSSVFAANSASAQAFSSTMTGIASDTASKVTTTEAQQWEKLTRQYDAFQTKRVSEADKYFREENRKLEAQYQKELKAQEDYANKSLAQETARLERQRLLNARFEASGASSKYNTTNRAMIYGSEGGDIEKQFGSAVAAKATASGLAELKKQAEDAKNKMHELSFANAGFTREVMVMGHELSQGSMRRFGGSVMVMANQINLAQVAIEKFGVGGIAAIGAFAVGLIALIAIIHAGEKEQNAFNMATILTGNYVGATRGELQQMAEAASKSSGTIGATKNVMLQLASSGAFTKDEIGKIAPVISNFSLVTGEAIGTVVADFEKLAKEPTKAVVELNNKYNFLTGAVYSQIAALEKQGDTQAAAALAEKTYATAMAQRTEDILKHQGDIIRGWAAIKKLASEVWDAMINYGSSTAKQELEAVNAQLKNVNALMEKQKANRPGGVDEGVLAAYRDLLNKKKALEDEFNRADTDSIQAQLNKQDIAARERDEQDRLHNRTRAEIRKEEIAKAMEDFNSENAAQIGLQLAAHGKSVADLKEFVAQTDNVTLKAGQERIDYEAQKSQKLLQIAQENGIALVKTEDELQKRIEDINKRHTDKKGDDSRKAKLDGDLENLKGILNEQQKAYEGEAADFVDQEKKKQISSVDFLTSIMVTREAYRMQENAFYDSSIAALKAYKGKNATEIQDIINKINDLKHARATANEGIDNAEESDHRLARDIELEQDKLIIEDIEKRGNKEVEAYQKTLKAMEQHLKALQNTKEQQDQMTEREILLAQLETENELKDATNLLATNTLTGEALKQENAMVLVLQNKLAALERMAVVAPQITEAQAKIDLQAFDEKQLAHSLQAAKEFEKVMTDAFGNIGKAIGQATSAFASYQKKLADVEKERKLATANQTDQGKIDAANKKASLDSLSAELGMYGEIAGAAKNYFDEGSRGYKALQAVQAAFQLASIAASLASFAAAAPAAIAKAGAQTGWVGAIAMAALMAALGFAASGGFDSNSGDATSAADRQSTQGTGTVFGDPTAKSNSIANSIELLSKNSVVGLKYSSEMLSALNSINEAMTGLAGLVIRTVGLSTGDIFNVPQGTLSKNTGDALTKMVSGFDDSVLTKNLPIIGDIVGKLQSLWGKVDQSVSDSGLLIQGTLKQLQNGGGYGQYENVQTTSSSFFGLVKDTKNKTLQQALTGDAQTQLSLVFRGIGDAVKSAASELGVNNAAFKSQVDNFNFNIGKVSLRGLSGQALQDALNNVFSAAADNLAKTVFPGLSAFQKAGEGYFQTALRVAGGTEAATEELDRLGLKAISYQQIYNKQGDVEAEIVRQTLVMDAFGNSLSGVIDIVNGFQGSASDLIKLYTQLVDVAHALESVHLSKNVTSAMIAGAGDLSSLQTGVSDYQQNYFTQAQQVQMETTELGYEFAKLGVVLPPTKEAFKQMVQGINTSTESGQRLQGGLLSLSGAFSKLMDNAQSAQQVAVDGLNSQESALQSAKDALKSFGDSIKQFSDSLMLGTNSILTPLQKLQAAQDQYETTLAAAKSGDKTAQGNLQGAASSYLDASRTANSSSGAYTGTYTKVQADLAGMLNSTAGQMSTAQSQIDALDHQISLLGTVSLYAQSTANNTGTLVTLTQTASTMAAVSASNQNQTTQAVNNLTTQVVDMKQQMAAQVAAQIKAQYDAQQRAANTITQGYNSAYQGATWMGNQNQPVI